MLPRIPRWPALFGGELGRAADGRNGPSSSRRTAGLRPDEEEAARGGGADRRAQQAGTPEGQETAPDVRPAQGYESRTKLALAPQGATGMPAVGAPRRSVRDKRVRFPPPPL